MAIINLPIETKNRELDGKLWLAANLAMEGHKISLGKKYRSGLITELQPHLHIAENPNHKIHNKIKKAGAHVGWLDTEGGVFTSIDKYTDRIDRILDGDSSNGIDFIICWGEKQATLIQNRTTFTGDQIYVTGNPRFDLLHPDLRSVYKQPAEQISELYGNFILFNTNFTYANPFNKERLEKKKKKIDTISPNNKLTFQKYLLDHFIKAIKTLSTQYPNHNVVVRPHPSENHNFYDEMFKNYPSIHTEHSGDVREWIYAADIVIHNGCTTGIEAAMLNTPVIAYEPDLNVSSHHPSLPNEVSLSVRSLDNLIREVDKFVTSSEPYQMSSSQRQELKKYFQNVDQLATPRIIELISKIDGLENDRPSLDHSSLRGRFERWMKNQPTAPYLRQAIDSIGFRRSAYEQQKFPGLSINELQSRLLDFEELIGETNFKVQRINKYDDIYWIERR